MQSGKYIFDDQCNWEPAGQGMKRKILGFNDKIMMVRVSFEKGSIGYLHKHVHDQVTYVESGKFEVTIESEKRILNPGDSFMMPSNIEHGVLALEEGCLIDVFSPCREDFLQAKS